MFISKKYAVANWNMNCLYMLRIVIKSFDIVDNRTIFIFFNFKESMSKLESADICFTTLDIKCLLFNERALSPNNALLIIEYKKSIQIRA